MNAKQAKRLYREMCTHKVGRTDPETGELKIERKRKLHAPGFKRWVRERWVRDRMAMPTQHGRPGAELSPKLHRIVFGGAS